MTSEPPESENGIPRPEGGGARSLGMPILLVAASSGALLMVFALPAFVLSLVGLMPSLLALATDDTQDRNASRCVVSMNLAGVIPIAVLAASAGNDMAEAMKMLTNPYVWLIMYGAAASGWGLLWLGPILAEGVVNQLVERENKKLQTRQRDLVAEWGRGVLED